MMESGGDRESWRGGPGRGRMCAAWPGLASWGKGGQLNKMKVKWEVSLAGTGWSAGQERMLCSGLEATQDGGKVWEPLRRQWGSRRF